jgi:hypothetical protein
MIENKEKLNEFYNDLLKEKEETSLKIESDAKRVLENIVKRTKRLANANLISLVIVCLAFIIQLIGLVTNGLRFKPMSLIMVIVFAGAIVLNMSYLKTFSKNMSKSLVNNDSNALKTAMVALDAYFRFKFTSFLGGCLILVLIILFILLENFI